MAADIDYIAGARQFKASHKISEFGVKVLGQKPPLRTRTLADSKPKCNPKAGRRRRDAISV
jgi:hypothetical protein